jgi:anti-anti-sigma factor
MEGAYYRLQRVVDIDSAGQLRADLLAVVKASREDVTVDCVHLEFIDSIGVAVISQIRRLLSVHDRRLRLINLSPQARRPFELLGHGGYFGIDATANE